MRWLAPALIAGLAMACAPSAQVRADRLKAQTEEFFEQSRYPEALATAEEALRLREEALGSRHPDVADAANDVGLVLRALERLEAARALFERAQDIWARVHGDEHPQVAIALNNLATLEADAGRYEASAALLRRAADMTERALGPDHPEMIGALCNLAQVLILDGAYREALPLLARARRLSEANPDAEQATFHATILSGLALIHQNLGNLVRARGLFEEAIQGARSEPASVVGITHSLANLLVAMGDTDAARALQERNIEETIRLLGPEHTLVGLGLNSLATTCAFAGLPDKARGLLLRARDILKRTWGSDHPDVAVVDVNLAHVLLDTGDIHGARELLLRGKAVFVKHLGPEHPEVVHAQEGLARADFLDGQLDRASRTAQRVLSVRRSRQGEAHPETLISQALLSRILWTAGELDAARSNYRAGLDALVRFLDPLFGITSERERIAVLLSWRDTLHEGLTLLDEPERAGETYDALLRLKGAASRSLLAQRRSIRDATDPAIGDKVAELTRVRRRLAAAFFAGAEEASLRAEKIRGLTRRKEELQRELATASAAYRNQRRLEDAGLSEICVHLADDEVVVDYLRYRRFEPSPRARPGPGRRVDSYLAFVIRGWDCAIPVRIELGAAGPIDVAVEGYRRLVERGSSVRRLHGVSAKLRERVWDPVAAVAARDGGPPARVWLVTDGALRGLPFEALRTKGGRYLIEEQALGTLASPVDLVRLDLAGRSASRGALLAGGIDYDGDATPGRAAAAPSSTRSLLGETDLLPVGALPSTSEEVETIAGLLRQAQPGEVRVLSGREATENRIATLGRGVRFLHVATHGFFAAGALRSALAPGDEEERRDRVVGYNPMLLSGLILAGANARAVGPNGEDGILTAEEVAGLDLGGAELVTLSACDTGLGEVLGGEGVMGLRRAFVQAGARALVLSLWKIPDDGTRELMELFYRRIVTRPEADKAEAMRQAKLELITRLRKRRGEAHPRDWAAFIVSGR